MFWNIESELERKLRAIDSEWKEAKNKLTRDVAYKRLTKENETLKGIYEPDNFST